MRYDDTGKFTTRIRGTTAELQGVIRQMRTQMTQPEQRLWEVIRNRQIKGLRFRAQHCVGRFVLDFYCPSHRLAIGLDGTSHCGEEERDASRTAHIEAFGYRVLRFKNAEVMSDLSAVLARIAAFAEEAL